MTDPVHVAYFLAGVPIALLVGMVFLWGLSRVIHKQLEQIGIVRAEELGSALDDRMSKHEEWERKLNQASRDVLRELIESYHRQGLEAVDQARRLAVRVASDHQQLHEHLTALDRRVLSLEKRVTHGNDS